MASRTSLGTGEVRNFYFDVKEDNGHSWGPTQPAVLLQNQVHVHIRVVPELYNRTLANEQATSLSWVF